MLIYWYTLYTKNRPYVEKLRATKWRKKGGGGRNENKVGNLIHSISFL